MWTEDVYQACCKVFPDNSSVSNGCKRDMPRQDTRGPSRLLNHFEEFARVYETEDSTRFFETYLALPISRVFPSMNQGSQNLSILDFFKRVSTPRDMKTDTSEKLKYFLNELQISANGLIVYRNQWKWKTKKSLPRFLHLHGRVGKGNNEGPCTFKCDGSTSPCTC